MNLQLIKKLCSMNRPQLYQILVKFLRKMEYTSIDAGDKYIIAEGDLPICLIAHIDTVFKYLPNIEDFYYDSRKKVLWRPGGSGFDDRAGVYIILTLLQQGYKPHIIFTDEEETGGQGAYSLLLKYKECPFMDCRALIQLDRANQKDCVFYNCNNKDFERYISSFGFKYDIGTFTDISIIAPNWGIAAVNLSVGYEDEHTSCERLHCDWCDNTLKKVENILNKSTLMKSYSYIPMKGNYFNWWRTWPNEEEEEKEEDTFDTENQCIICGKELNNSNTGYVIDDEYGFKVCKDCFSQYYF